MDVLSLEPTNKSEDVCYVTASVASVKVNTSRATTCCQQVIHEVPSGFQSFLNLGPVIEARTESEDLAIH